MMKFDDFSKDSPALPERKPARWQGFDYSNTGAYFVTVCVQNRKCLLSAVVGEGLAPPEIKLTACGRIAEQQLLLLQSRYNCVQIDRYVIMPNHIHAILFLKNEAGGASPSPTLSDVICSFKSLTSRLCKRKNGTVHIFQRSYYDHVIRDRKDYEMHVKYISENPWKWKEDDLYTDG
jgi:REP element-mobilizing transposase RayT